jgi:hypothetical protein
MSWEIRNFNESDRPAILEISKHTWGGYDQFPYELERILANPGAHLFVMEYKNWIITFANLNVIEGGAIGIWKGSYTSYSA